MYGFSGYATNSYATRRLFSGRTIIVPVVKLGMRVLQNTYGIVNALMLRFRGTILTNPSSNSNSLEL
jgi:hypothetical protein